MKASPFYPALDGLRCIAVFLVLWHHIPYLFDRSLHATLFWSWSYAGSLGVDLFFVISGFLITSILVRSRGEPQPLYRFWIRRSLRIFPLFYLYMTAVVVSVYLLGLFVPQGRIPHTAGELFPFLVYLANLEILRHGWFAGEFNILWSLAVEEQFYLLWPLFAIRLQPRALLQLSASVVLLTPLFRAASALLIGVRATTVAPFCRADALLCGAILALLVEDDRWRERILALCARLAPLALGFLLWIVCGPWKVLIPGHISGAWLIFGPTVVAISLTLIVGAVVRCGPFSRLLLTSGPVSYLGRISYGIYLWQWLVGDLLTAGLYRYFPALNRYPINAGLWMLVLIGVASLSWFGMERPILRLKARYASDAEPAPEPVSDPGPGPGGAGIPPNGRPGY